MLCHRKILILLDDVDKLDQLEVLAGKHNWFGSGSRIIITTRDGHLLKTHKVDLVYPIRLFSHDEAIQLFKRYAYNEEEPLEDYEMLSLSVVSYAAGLPLALKVLGSFLYDKNKKGWMSALARLKDIPEKEIMEKLKISFDGLNDVEKEIFLDIACFFRGEDKDYAMEILEACNFHPEIGIETLRQKSLVNIVHNCFDMHDLVQEMGQYIVRCKHPNNPEKHSRVWKDKIRNLCFRDITMENNSIEAIRHVGYSRGHDLSSRFSGIVSKMKKLRCLSVSCNYDERPTFLSNELQYLYWEGPLASPFAECFQPMNLVVLKLCGSMQKEVWTGWKYLPHLRELQLFDMKKLLRTLDFDGLPSLQKFILFYCSQLEEIHPSLSNQTNLEYLEVAHCVKITNFPTFVHMKNLKTLRIQNCSLKDGKIPSGIVELSYLQELNLSWNDFLRLDFSLLQLTRLKLLNMSYCNRLLELPELPSSLSILTIDGCESLTTIGDCHKNCKWLCQVTLMHVGIINDGSILLQSMLQGKAIENGCMLLLLDAVEFEKGFRPPRCNEYRFPHPNWCDEFSGFLIQVVFFTYDVNCWDDDLEISMYNLMRGMEYQHDVFCGEYDSDPLVDVGKEYSDSDSDNDGDGDKYKHTLVGYVSFGSLKHTSWWEHKKNFLSFEVKTNTICSTTIRLLKRCGSGLMETTYSSSDYAPSLQIKQDSPFILNISLSFYDGEQYV